MESIKIHEVCIIAPNDPPSEFSLPLTFLDMSWLRADPASRLFFYEFPEPNTDFSKNILPKLKKSLSITLQTYLPVAGFLTWPQDSETPVVQYKTGDGVSLTIAETQSDFYSLSGNVFRSAVELHSLVPDFPSSKTKAPVIILQITLFPNIGYSIGFVAHHGILDGKSASLFMHSWACICKNGDDSVLPPELTPSFDRSFVKNQSELERTYPKFGPPTNSENRSLMVVNKTCPHDILLGTFCLTRDNIDTLKKIIYESRKQKAIQESGTRLSTFNVSSAYVFLCLVKAKKLMSEEAVITITIDARGRLQPPISSTYFGNCVLACQSGGNAKNYLSEDGFANAVESVKDGLALINEGVLKVAERLKKFLEDLKNEVYKDSGLFVIAGSPRFELYKADFGWGRPRKVEMISNAKTGAFYLSDDRDGNGGIEIGVALSEHEAQLFKSAFVSGLEAC